jgi:glycosyltransferase involved in cell wall biosynthesis
MKSASSARAVWIFNHYAQEPGGPGGTRHFTIARHLQAAGWNAVIIAASVELNTGRQRLQAAESTRMESFEGIPFLWLRTPGHTGNGVGRLLNMLAYTLKAWRTVPRMLPRPDVIVGSSVHPFAAWAAERCASKLGVPFIFEVRDLWPQTLVDLGRLRDGSLAVRAMRWLEKRLYDRATKIIALMPAARDYIEPLGIPADRIVWIPNGVDIDVFPLVPPSDAEDRLSLMYFGAHGTANGLDNILMALARLKDQALSKKIGLRLIGDGPLKPALRRLAAELMLENVSFEDPVPKAEIPRLAAEADAFVFNLVDSPVFKHGISSNKLFDFMAASRPIIFSCGAINNPVRDADAGLTVKPGSPDELAGAIAQVARMSNAERARLGANARRYVESNFDYRVISRRFATTLDEALTPAKALRCQGSIGVQ